MKEIDLYGLLPKKEGTERSSAVIDINLSADNLQVPIKLTRWVTLTFRMGDTYAAGSEVVERSINQRAG